MSTITQLLCNHFGGIREKSAIFNEEMISAKDLQNVELYYTEINGGIGLRTTKGNKAVNSTLEGECKIINIWESIQGGATYCFVHAEDDTNGYFYLYDYLTKTLTLKKTLSAVTGASTGFDVAQGYSDLFFFTNGNQMFTIALAPKTLYAFVQGGATIYADKSSEPTQLYTVDSMSYTKYTGTEWTISGTNVKRNGTNATYTQSSNVTFDSDICNMIPVGTDGKNVIGLCAAVFNNRLFIANGSNLWYSMIANIYDFSTHSGDWTTSAGNIEFSKDITALHEYLSSLAIFHKDSSELLSVLSDGSFSRGDDSPGGCASYNSLVFHDTNLYFYDDTKKAVFSFRQVVTGEKTLGENVAAEVEDVLKDIDRNNLQGIRTLSVFLEDRNEIWWILPINDTYKHTSVQNNVTTSTQKPASIILIYDYLKGEWIKRKSQKINTIRIVNNKLYSGSNDGVILEEYQTNTFNGQYIPHFYKCSPCNLGAMNTLKVFLFPPRLSLDMPFVNDFYVKYTKNYDIIRKPKKKHIKTKNKGLYYTDIDFCDDSYTAPKTTGLTAKFPNATFKILEIEIYTQDGTNDFCIKNIEFSKIKVKQV